MIRLKQLVALLLIALPLVTTFANGSSSIGGSHSSSSSFKQVVSW
jgi:hypothetical protein